MSANQKYKSRSLTERGAATRSRIVKAAADLMYEHGVDRTSLDEVMAASGVSKSQLYHYFADKDALVLAVIALQAERVLDAQQPHLEARALEPQPPRLGAEHGGQAIRAVLVLCVQVIEFGQQVRGLQRGEARQ